MKFETYNEFESWFDKISDDNKIEIFNEFWDDVDDSNCIYPMSEFNQVLYGYRLIAIARLVEDSDSFSTHDDYFVITYLGDLVSYSKKEAIVYMKEKFKETFDEEGEIEI